MKSGKRCTRIALCVLTAFAVLGLPRAFADLDDVADALVSSTIDIAESEAATAIFVAMHPDDACPMRVKGTGTEAGHSPYGDPIYGHDYAVATAVCPSMPPLVELKVTVQYHSSARLWEDTEHFTTCQSRAQAIPTPIPPCILATDLFPGASPPTAEDPEPVWLHKCRRAKLELIAPATGQPPMYTSIWGCAQSLSIRA